LNFVSTFTLKLVFRLCRYRSISSD